MTEQRDVIFIPPGDWASLTRLLTRLADRLDQLEGLRDDPTFYSEVFKYPINEISGVLRAASTADQARFTAILASDLPDHSHTAIDQGGDYPWADFVTLDVTYLQALRTRIDQENLVDKTANEEITGGWTYDFGQQYTLHDPDGTVIHQYNYDMIPDFSEVNRFINGVDEDLDLHPNQDLDQTSDADFNSVKTPRVKLTPAGALAIKLTNNTGATSEVGRLVKADTTADNAVILTAVNDAECLGVLQEDGIPDGNEIWVAVSGRVQVLLDDDTGAAAGDCLSTGEAGYALASSTPVSPSYEVGNTVQAVSAGGAGTHVLVWTVINFRSIA